MQGQNTGAKCKCKCEQTGLNNILVYALHTLENWEVTGVKCQFTTFDSETSLAKQTSLLAFFSNICQEEVLATPKRKWLDAGRSTK